MEISNGLYDVGKWLVLVFMPAFAVFIGGVGELYGWSDTSLVVSLVNLLAVFLGTVLQISSQVYNDGDFGDGFDDGFGGGVDG